MSTESSAPSLAIYSGSSTKISDGKLPSMESSDCSFDRSLDKALEYFYDNNLYTDVVFQIHYGNRLKTFSCHKLILSMWSPVFAKMFFKEDSSLPREIIDITDVPPWAFEIIIKYCYGLDTELQTYHHEISVLIDVCKGAMLYKINGLIILCSEELSCALPTKENVFDLLDAASFINSECLKLDCYKVLQTQTQQIIISRDFVNFSRSDIDKILEMPTLSLSSEYELITWLFNWARHEASKGEDVAIKEIMKPFLPRMNFLALNPEEFGFLVLAQKEFFEQKDGFAIFMNIVCPESLWLLPPWCNKELSRSFIGGDLESTDVL